jgi:geranylgeranyl pyrophosphate synthase
MPNLKLIDSWSQSQESFTQRVEDQIIQICNFNPSQNPSFESLNLFLINFFKRKSKKVRCKITFECAKSLNIDYEDAVKIAAAVELIHNASILHDKISDEFSESIKNKDSVNNNLISGDFLISSAFLLISSINNSCLGDLIKILSKSIMVTSIGQINDLYHEQKSFNLNDDLTTFCYKSGSLIVLPIELCSKLHTTRDNSNLLQELKFNLGTAYQIADDIDDIESDLKDNNNNIVLRYCKEHKVNKTEGISQLQNIAISNLDLAIQKTSLTNLKIQSTIKQITSYLRVKLQN